MDNENIQSPSYDDVLREQLLEAAENMAGSDIGTLNLKIAGTAFRELHKAFQVFGPHKGKKKVTIFGSARVGEDSVLYSTARSLAGEMAVRGWMTVTGAGPGIMRAGMEGAGWGNSLGVTIQLPFEDSEGAALTEAGNVSSMKYFFTRKLMLCKESHAFVCMPGGFGTQDETFEQLTLMQTGKAGIAPLVLLDADGMSYWSDWMAWCGKHLVDGGFIDKDDLSFLHLAESWEDAADHITRFYSVYDSMRWAGDRLIIRTSSRVSDERLEELNEKFGHLCTRGGIERSVVSRGEERDRELLDYERIALRFDKKNNGGLRKMIDVINKPYNV